VSRRLLWERDGRDWPNRAASRFVTARGLRWHIQVMGDGPVLLLLHGTGASTHSWRALASLLAPRFTVVAPDLPGHGFTDTPRTPAGFSLPNVTKAVAALLHALQVRPVLAVGHSAGAAIAARLCLDGAIKPRAVVSLNGALLPFPGMSNDFFGPIARVLAGSRLASRTFAFFAGSGLSVERLLRSTGSRIDAEGTRLYARLAANPVHVAGALGLMANWDLQPLVCDLPRLPARLILVAGSNDGMVPPSEIYRVRSLVPRADLITLRGLGHLAHEEKPGEIAALLERVALDDPPA
jgi:magnesium chelatase accessory protein